MDLGIEGRVAIVTGASKGLGRGCADALANEGVRLVLNARGSEALSLAEETLRSAGAEVLSVAGDVTEAEMPARLVETAIERFGQLDIVVSNSGGPPRKRALEVEDDEVIAAVESNLLTHVRFVRQALPHMRERGWGRFCAIASAAVVQPLPHLALSSIARTGLRAWIRSASGDLKGSGITLNLLGPGSHDTERTREIGSQAKALLGSAADFGQVAAFLCSAQARHVNGATIIVDGGETLAL